MCVHAGKPGGSKRCGSTECTASLCTAPPPAMRRTQAMCAYLPWSSFCLGSPPQLSSHKKHTFSIILGKSAGAAVGVVAAAAGALSSSSREKKTRCYLVRQCATRDWVSRLFLFRLFAHWSKERESLDTPEEDGDEETCGGWRVTPHVWVYRFGVRGLAMHSLGEG